MKICFWGDIAEALKGNTNGGGELQIALLAKALARGGHEVVIIDYKTTEDFITADGIKVFKIKGWNNGITDYSNFYTSFATIILEFKSSESRCLLLPYS